MSLGEYCDPHTASSVFLILICACTCVCDWRTVLQKKWLQHNCGNGNLSSQHFSHQLLKWLLPATDIMYDDLWDFVISNDFLTWHPGLFFFFFNCIFYQLLHVQHSCSSTQSWGSVLPSIVETRDQNSRGCPLLFSNRNLGSFCA